MMKTEVQVSIPAGQFTKVSGDLVLPKETEGVILFAHGSGSSRLSSRNRYVAAALQESGLGTLLMDLLTEEEERQEMYTAHLRFDIELLANRLLSATKWLQANNATRHLAIGYFGASTGAAAALMAAAQLSDQIGAVVSRGGRPDLAMEHLTKVPSPTLLIVGGNDHPVIEMNQSAYDALTCQKKLEIVPAASHLFEEPGKLESVANLARTWFSHHLQHHPAHH